MNCTKSVIKTKCNTTIDTLCVNSGVVMSFLRNKIQLSDTANKKLKVIVNIGILIPLSHFYFYKINKNNPLILLLFQGFSFLPLLSQLLT